MERIVPQPAIEIAGRVLRDMTHLSINGVMVERERIEALAVTQPASASIPPKAAVQDRKDQQGAQAGAEPLRPLTDEQIYAIAEDFDPQESYVVFARAILAARGALAEPQAEPPFDHAHPDSWRYEAKSGGGAGVETPDPNMRRLTALWRFGVTVLPPTCGDFYAWLAVLDAAIDERTKRHG